LPSVDYVKPFQKPERCLTESCAEKHQTPFAGAAAHNENLALQDRDCPGSVEEGSGAADRSLGPNGIQGGLDGRGGNDPRHREQN
jgi:hypothetical protein